MKALHHVGVLIGKLGVAKAEIPSKKLSVTVVQFCYNPYYELGRLGLLLSSNDFAGCHSS